MDRLIFNQGHMSCRSSFIKYFFNPTNIIADYYLTNICRQMFADRLSASVFVEQPVLHLRTIRNGGGDAFSKTLLDTIKKDFRAKNHNDYTRYLNDNMDVKTTFLEEYGINSIVDAKLFSLKDRKKKDIVTIKYYLQHLDNFVINNESILYEINKNKKFISKLEHIIDEIKNTVIPILENKDSEKMTSESVGRKVDLLISSISSWKIITQ